MLQDLSVYDPINKNGPDARSGPRPQPAQARSCVPTVAANQVLIVPGIFGSFHNPTIV